MIRESEDLPFCFRFVEKANPQATALGDFFLPDGKIFN